MANFQLYETLAADTVEIVRWPLCRVLLMNDSRYPWLIFVPERPNMKEIHDLDARDQELLMSELNRASRTLTELYSPDKINIGVLGNIVSQLHIHVVARYSGDAAWPGPVWGAHPPKPYGSTKINDVRKKLLTALQ